MKGSRTPTSAYPKKRGRCTWCQRAVKPPKQTWCGAERCLHEYKMATDQGYRRDAVYQRDLGVCCDCGRDCAADEDRLRRLRDDAARAWRAEEEVPIDLDRLGEPHPEVLRLRGLAAAAVAAYREAGAALRLTPAQLADTLHLPHPGVAVVRPVPTVWEADHVVELADRGANGLDNLATRCRPCHRAKTNRQATARRAKRSITA